MDAKELNFKGFIRHSTPPCPSQSAKAQSEALERLSVKLT
jgi:hypothetical protein